MSVMLQHHTQNLPCLYAGYTLVLEIHEIEIQWGLNIMEKEQKKWTEFPFVPKNVLMKVMLVLVHKNIHINIMILLEADILF